MSLEMLKSVLTSVVVVLALLQAVEMAQIRGKVNFLPLNKRVLRMLHRGGGIAALALMLVVALLCVFGEGYAPQTLRVWTHVVLGVLALLVLAAKVVITHRARRFLRFNNAFGYTVGVLVLGTFASSALWYFGVLRW